MSSSNALLSFCVAYPERFLDFSGLVVAVRFGRVAASRSRQLTSNLACPLACGEHFWRAWRPQLMRFVPGISRSDANQVRLFEHVGSAWLCNVNRPMAVLAYHFDAALLVSNCTLHYDNDEQYTPCIFLYHIPHYLGLP